MRSMLEELHPSWLQSSNWRIYNNMHASSKLAQRHTSRKLLCKSHCSGTLNQDFACMHLIMLASWCLDWDIRWSSSNSGWDCCLLVCCHRLVIHWIRKTGFRWVATKAPVAVTTFRIMKCWCSRHLTWHRWDPYELSFWKQPCVILRSCKASCHLLFTNMNGNSVQHSTAAMCGLLRQCVAT